MCSLYMRGEHVKRQHIYTFNTPASNRFQKELGRTYFRFMVERTTHHNAGDSASEMINGPEDNVIRQNLQEPYHIL